MEPPGPVVVSERKPCPYRVPYWNLRKRLEGRKPIEPFLVLRQNPVDLGLLEHHFGHQNSVWILRLSPR